MRSFGALHITGGAQTQSLTTAAGQVVAFSAAGGSAGDDDSNQQGDASVIPDAANNRIKVNCPGTYKLTAIVQGTIDTAGDVVLQARKNSVAISKLKTKQRVTANKDQIVLCGLFKVTSADLPSTGLATFADPSAAAGAGKPSGGFAGAGAAPQTEVSLDLTLAMASGAQVLTLEEVQFTVEQMTN